MSAWSPSPLPALHGPLVAPPAEETFPGPEAPEIVAAWTSTGLRWLASQTRAQLRRFLSCLADPVRGNDRLYQNSGFLSALLEMAEQKLAPNRAATALRHAVFQVWPVPARLADPLGAWVRQGWTHRLPDWYRDDFAELPQILWDLLEKEQSRSTTVLSPEAVVACLWRLGVPSSFWRGNWIQPLIEVGLLRMNEVPSLPLVRLLLQLCDQNTVAKPGSPINNSHKTLIRTTVRWGSRTPGARTGIARLLVGRLGSPTTFPQQWAGLETEVGLLRSWLMEAFLVDVWAPLSGRSLRRPAGERTDPWALYDQEIQKVIFLVSPDVAKTVPAEILAGTEETVTMQIMPSLGKGIAALWLTLRQGSMSATVLEWGNQGQFQIRTGEHLPGSSLKNAQALCWAGWEYSIAPDAYWQDKLIDRLGWAGVRVRQGVGK